MENLKVFRSLAVEYNGSLRLYRSAKKLEFKFSYLKKKMAEMSRQIRLAWQIRAFHHFV